MCLPLRSTLCAVVLASVCHASTSPSTEWAVTDVYTSSGTHVSAPVFVNSNLTWKFDMVLLADQDSVIMPLFSNLTRQRLLDEHQQNFDRSACTGYVSVCCLHELAGYYMNEELQALVTLLGPCENLPHLQSSEALLADMPPTKSFVNYAFPRAPGYPRVWGADAYTYALEILFENLPAAWLTTYLGHSQSAAPADVVDRSMHVVFAYVRPTPVNRLHIVLSDHVLLFHEATRHIDDNSEVVHGSFFHACTHIPKPEHSLWRADVLPLNMSCLWFCLPGYHLYPSATDYYHTSMVPQTLENSACSLVPTIGAMVVLDLQVNFTHDPHNPGHKDEYTAFTMIALQETLADATGVRRHASTFYLQSTHSVPWIEWNGSEWNGSLVLQTMSVSAVLYTDDITNNATTQELSVLKALFAPETAAVLLRNINKNTNITHTTQADIEVVWIYTETRFPPVSEKFPVRDVVVLSLWVTCFAPFVLVALDTAFQRLRNEKRRRRRKAFIERFM